MLLDVETTVAYSFCLMYCSLHEAMPLVVQQLSELWSLRMIKLLFEPLFLFTASLDSSLSEASSYAAASPSKS